MEKLELDGTDEKILESVRSHNGSHVNAILKPILSSVCCAEITLRERLRRLERNGYVKLEKNDSGRIIVYLVQ